MATVMMHNHGEHAPQVMFDGKPLDHGSYTLGVKCWNNSLASDNLTIFVDPAHLRAFGGALVAAGQAMVEAAPAEVEPEMDAEEAQP